MSGRRCAVRCRATTDRKTMGAHEFATRLRNRERLLGYWSVMDCPVSTEWLAHVGWDYIALDVQHGLIGYPGMVAGLTAIDAAGSPAGGVPGGGHGATGNGGGFGGGGGGGDGSEGDGRGEDAQ